MGPQEKAIVLLSGGIDSAVTLWWANAKGWAVRPLTFHYFRRPPQEVVATRKLLELSGIRNLREVDLPFLREVDDLKDAGLENPALLGLEPEVLQLLQLHVPPRPLEPRQDPGPDPPPAEREVEGRGREAGPRARRAVRAHVVLLLGPRRPLRDVRLVRGAEGGVPGPRRPGPDPLRTRRRGRARARRRRRGCCN